MKIIALLCACSVFFARTLPASSLEEQNKVIAKQVFEEIISKGNFGLFEQLYATDFLSHGVYRDADMKEDLALLKGWHQAFSDLVVDPRKVIAEGDLVTVYWVAHGKNTGEGNGIPATGKKIVSTGITIWRIEGGKIKEEWSAFNQLELMQQLGLISFENK